MTELSRMWKELLVTNFNYLPRDSENKETTELRYYIRNQKLPNTKQGG
jgi:hypothetical protein